MPISDWQHAAQPRGLEAMLTKTSTCGAWVWLGVLTACGAARGATPLEPPIASDPASATPARSASAAPGPSTREALERACDSGAECEVAWLVTDCCGSAQAVGVRRGTREAAEQTARSAHGGGSCECLAAPPRLESGRVVEAPSDVVVACDEHQCVAYVAEPMASEPAALPPPQEPAAEAPVPCRSSRDCWVTGHPERPIARPRSVHHSFRGCMDGEVPPVCDQGVCALGFRLAC